jgi:ATP-dependent DNA helicase RecG
MIKRQELERLLADLESDRVERTRSTTDTDKFGEAICAFANDLPDHRQPGYLVLGVDDTGRPTGLAVTDELLRNLAAIRSDGNLLPSPALAVEKMDLDGGSVAVVEVQPSRDTPVRYKGRVWIRVGPRKGVANAEEERRLTEKRAAFLARTWDARPCPDATLDDLALELFALDYRRAAVAPETVAENDRPLPQQMAALRLYDLREERPTHAAVLLFGRDPERFVPGAYVQFVQYEGDSAAAEVLEERRLQGDLISILRGLDELGRDLARARPVSAEGFREQTIYDFPPRALRELFVNTVVHRNYEGSTAPVQISCFRDRLEIWNVGGLHPDLSPEHFPRGTAYRNPVLAEAARVLGYANRFGRGIAVAKDELARNGSPEPSFDFQPNHFLVTVWRRV